MRDSLSANTTAIKLGQIGYPENDFPGRNTVAAIKSAEFAMVVLSTEAVKGTFSRLLLGPSELRNEKTPPADWH